MQDFLAHYGGEGRFSLARHLFFALHRRVRRRAEGCCYRQDCIHECHVLRMFCDIDGDNDSTSHTKAEHADPRLVKPFGKHAHLQCFGQNKLQ